MKHKLLISLLCAALVAALAGTTTADDVGDGWEPCNRGEICFRDRAADSRWEKHFWWNAHHSGYRWWDSEENRYTGKVANDAASVRNRDTRCAVTVFAYIGPEHFNHVTVANHGWNQLLPNSVRDQNDEHRRCTGLD